MLAIEHQHPHFLVRQITHLPAVAVEHLTRTAERLIALPGFFRIRASAQLHGGDQGRHFRRSQPLLVPELFGFGPQQSDQPMIGQQRLRHVNRVPTLKAGSEQDRQQLGVRQRRRALAQQTLARTLLLGDIADTKAELGWRILLNRFGIAAHSCSRPPNWGRSTLSELASARSRRSSCVLQSSGSSSSSPSSSSAPGTSSLPSGRQAIRALVCG